MIVIKYNTDKPDQWLSPLDFPLKLINEQGIEYRIIRTEEDGYTCIKPKKEKITENHI